MQKILRFLAAGAAGCLLGAVVCGPADADVKAGVDAWSQGQYEAAIRQWRPLADRGDPDAEFNLAQAYKMGRGVPLDLEQAETLYGKAAAQGHIPAADNYGLLLFQRGQREKAMPYIAAAAARGDARAQYILGIAHFNGDLAEKDWVRAYALVSLAQQAGLPQATRALAQMDEHIPIEQRQDSVALATRLRADAEAARARMETSAALAGPGTAMEVEGDAGPALAGADYTRPSAPARSAKPASAPAPHFAAPHFAAPLPAASLSAASAAIARPATARPASRAELQGGWRVQLGAFGVAGNADRLWSSLAKRAELAGHRREKERQGALTFLYATGFSDRAAADKACAALKSSGHDCLVSPPK